MAFVISENLYEFNNVVTLGLSLFIVIPLLSLVTGVVSLNILRLKTESLVGNSDFTVSYNVNPKKVAILIAALPLILIGYYAFNEYGNSGLTSLAIAQSGLLLARYFCFSLNAVFFDIFVVRYTAGTIATGVVCHPVISFLVYSAFILFFGLSGWVAACFLLNCGATCAFVIMLHSSQLSPAAA